MASGKRSGLGWQFKDMTGQKFGRLTAIRVARRAQSVHWLFRCDCGNEKVIEGGVVRRGVTVSCGCYATERKRASGKHKGTGTSEYCSWQEMKSRCLNPDAPGYKYYGGRGIVICERWLHSFESFRNDMGLKPDPSYTLERIDSDGNYEPSNCRWATRSEQMRNTRATFLITFLGKTQCLTDWATELGINWKTLRYRVRHWGIGRAFTTPVDTKCRPK